MGLLKINVSSTSFEISYLWFKVKISIDINVYLILDIVLHFEA